MEHLRARRRTGLAAAATLGALLATSGVPAPPTSTAPPSASSATVSVIVQARDTASAAAAARAVGGTVTHELEIINAVAATVTADGARHLASVCPDCRIYPNRSTARLMGYQ